MLSWMQMQIMCIEHSKNTPILVGKGKRILRRKAAVNLSGKVGLYGQEKAQSRTNSRFSGDYAHQSKIRVLVKKGEKMPFLSKSQQNKSPHKT